MKPSLPFTRELGKIRPFNPVLWQLTTGVDPQDTCKLAGVLVNAPPTLTIRLGPFQNANIVAGTGYDSKNFLGHSTLMANWNQATSSIGLIQFDVSTLPSSARVTSATLDLYDIYHAMFVFGIGAKYELFLNTSPWSEATVTYLTRPTIDAAVVSWKSGLTHEEGHHLFDVTTVVLTCRYSSDQRLLENSADRIG